MKLLFAVLAIVTVPAVMCLPVHHTCEYCEQPCGTSSVLEWALFGFDGKVHWDCFRKAHPAP